jgi:hypothetical protein
MSDKPVKWPGWYYGPDNASAIFESADEVPEGWEDHPSKVKAAPREPEPKAGAKPKPANPLTALRAEYKAVTGKNPSPKSTAEDLQATITAAKEQAE